MKKAYLVANAEGVLLAGFTTLEAAKASVCKTFVSRAIPRVTWDFKVIDGTNTMECRLGGQLMASIGTILLQNGATTLV